ncbi:MULTISPECIES: hypothetical protein [unclassified Ekhidna]|jgi:hypothetical protein|uniref:hypothetical protein n=1 Tax=unclassified Ekhidna TaxID=2632188 RepID=UPI0032DF968B
MSDTLLIWFNPDAQIYEAGPYVDYKSIATESRNQDRFEVLYEFNRETISVADKILNALNIARTNSHFLNF